MMCVYGCVCNADQVSLLGPVLRPAIRNPHGRQNPWNRIAMTYNSDTDTLLALHYSGQQYLATDPVAYRIHKGTQKPTC